MTESEIILKALEELGEATISDIVEKTGINTFKVSSTIHNFRSTGKAYKVGWRWLTETKKVLLYSTKEKKDEPKKIEKQSWFSPLLQ